MKKRDVFFAALAILAFWQVSALFINRNILPPPLIVIQVFFREIFNGNMLEHAVASLWRVVASMFLSVALAAPAGLALGQSQRLNRIFSPVIYLLYPIPKVVLVP
ncbi:MAG: ABC transporter permease, partial [Anaerolineales bacterium]|nr:ABC transporter permease [Anaerolineales bacterium]